MKTDVNEVFAAFVTADVPSGSVIEGFDTTEALVSKVKNDFCNNQNTDLWNGIRSYHTEK